VPVSRLRASAVPAWWKHATVFFVNGTNQLWNQLPANALGTLSCKPIYFRKRVGKVINKAK
jgi:hypothetical protein